MSKNNKKLSTEQIEKLLITLRTRFEKNNYTNLEWTKIKTRLEANPDKIWSLQQMEETGGEPDVVDYDNQTDEYLFYDCTAESPQGRRSICYDHKALVARKKHKPAHSALNMATEMGINLLTEEQYHALQQLGKFDTKTSSWLSTPADIRKLGGAIFGDFRFGRVFIYHNGADSYYGARGFRGILKV